MNTMLRSVAVGAAVAIVVIGALFVYQKYGTGPSYVVPPPSGQYTNIQHDFTFTVPEGFEVVEKDNLVVLKDTQGNGLQLVITRLGRDTEVLDEALIRRDLPDLVIKNPQSVSIAGAGTGLAFRGENPAFEGKSRELWFIEDGYLFQFITYDRLAPLLSAIYGTLKFF